jgi:hypothetical protein
MLPSGDVWQHRRREETKVTVALERDALSGHPLAPVTAALRAMFGTSTELPGLAPDLLVRDPARWNPGSELAGRHLPTLLDSAQRRWNAQPHAAAALAWKAYTYWLALPAVLGWASVRRVPLLTADDVLVHFDDRRPLVTLGLRPDITVAVLPSDPLALSGRVAGVRVVADEATLLAELRRSLLDQHLTPLLEAMRRQVRIGERTLLGSLASGVAYGVLRSTDTLPGSSAETIATLLTALGVADLIELAPGPTGALTVQRRTCCLAFTLPKPKVCSGCCIR